MALPFKFRRAVSIVIPLFTTLLLWGVIKIFFTVDASTNIAQTGVTVGFIIGGLNAWLTWLIYKHQVP